MNDRSTEQPTPRTDTQANNTAADGRSERTDAKAGNVMTNVPDAPIEAQTAAQANNAAAACRGLYSSARPYGVAVDAQNARTAARADNAAAKGQNAHADIMKRRAAGAPDMIKKRTYARWVSVERVEIFRGPVLVWKNAFHVNPTPQVLEEAGYLPLEDGTLRDGKHLCSIYSTDGHRILRHTIEVTQ